MISSTHATTSTGIEVIVKHVCNGHGMTCGAEEHIRFLHPSVLLRFVFSFFDFLHSLKDLFSTRVYEEDIQRQGSIAAIMLPA